MPNQDFRRLRAWCAAGVMLAALVVYGLTLAPTISFWDCGEYVTTAHILGIPHQPGTPLYVLVGRCFDILLFWLSTAMAVNFMSAFFSALGVMFIFLVVSDLARRAEPDSGWLAEAAGLPDDAPHRLRPPDQAVEPERGRHRLPQVAVFLHQHENCLFE